MKKTLLATGVRLKKTACILAFCTLALLPMRGFCQNDPVLDDDLELPCGGDNPYATECPLDTWTFILVVGGVIFGVVSIYAAQKRADKVANVKYTGNVADIKQSA